MPLVEAAQDQCPAPGGCKSCPDRSYCAGLRVGLGMTTVIDEFTEGQAPYGKEFTITALPKEENG